MPIRRDSDHHGKTIRSAKQAELKKAFGGAKGEWSDWWGSKPSDHAGRTVVIIHRGSFPGLGIKQFGGGFVTPNFMPFDGSGPFGGDWLPPGGSGGGGWFNQKSPGGPWADQDRWGKDDWGSLEDLWDSERWKDEAPWGGLQDMGDLLGEDAPWLGLPGLDGAEKLEFAEFCAQLQSGDLFDDLEGLDDADESSLGLLLFGAMFLDGIFEDLCAQPTPDTETQDPTPDTDGETSSSDNT